MSKLAASFPCYGGAVLLRSCKGVSLYAYNLWQVFLQHIERPSITYKLRVWPLLLKPWRAVNQPPDIVMISDWTKWIVSFCLCNSSCVHFQDGWDAWQRESYFLDLPSTAPILFHIGCMDPRAVLKASAFSIGVRACDADSMLSV